MATDVIPFGIVQVPVPAVNVIMQSSPLAIAEAVSPETVGVQSLFERARAEGAVTIETADNVETAKTDAKKK